MHVEPPVMWAPGLKYRIKFDENGDATLYGLRSFHTSGGDVALQVIVFVEKDIQLCVYHGRCVRNCRDASGSRAKETIRT